MTRPRLHLIAPAGSCRKFIDRMRLASAAELIAIVQDAVGSNVLVTGNEALIAAVEDESRGGRDDDRQRAADIQNALADSDVIAMAALRGGSWLTRILPHIDFTVLNERVRPIAVFGFSELTTLVNIVGAHARGIGIYDMSPAFLTYGLRRHLRNSHCHDDAPHRLKYDREGAEGTEATDAKIEAEVQSRMLPEFRAFFQDVVSMIEGRGTTRKVIARLLGDNAQCLPESMNATFIGGNLCVLTTLLGSPYRECIFPAGRWVVLEEYNEHPYRLDRFLAQLTLAGFWDACEGILLGDFHRGSIDQLSIFQSLLAYHLPPDRPIPILATRQVGHTWPMSPFPLHRQLTIKRTEADRCVIEWPPSTLCVI